MLLSANQAPGLDVSESDFSGTDFSTISIWRLSTIKIADVNTSIQIYVHVKIGQLIIYIEHLRSALFTKRQIYHEIKVQQISHKFVNIWSVAIVEYAI